MSRILAIDPGTEKSAFVVLTGPDEPFQILDKGVESNDDLRRILFLEGPLAVSDFAIEMVASYGMAVGQTTFETVFWVGRFWELAGRANIPNRARLYRKTDVAMHLCHSMRAKDTNIRQALIDRFGEPGTKASPGVLYGVSTHIWAALAVGVTYRDRLEKK